MRFVSEVVEVMPKESTPAGNVQLHLRQADGVKAVLAIFSVRGCLIIQYIKTDHMSAS